MAKLAFSKLQKIKSIPDIVDTTVFEGCELKIKQYLPLAEKLNLLTNVLELSGTDEGYFNLVQLEVFYKIEVIKTYTNISFTDKQLEDPAKLYDSIVMNGVWESVSSLIPQNELDYVWETILAMAEEITTYNRSLAGMIKALSMDYADLNAIASGVQSQIETPEMQALLKAFSSNGQNN